MQFFFWFGSIRWWNSFILDLGVVLCRICSIVIFAVRFHPPSWILLTRFFYKSFSTFFPLSFVDLFSSKMDTIKSTTNTCKRLHKYWLIILQQKTLSGVRYFYPRNFFFLIIFPPFFFLSFIFYSLPQILISPVYLFLIVNLCPIYFRFFSTTIISQGNLFSQRDFVL